MLHLHFVCRASFRAAACVLEDFNVPENGRNYGQILSDYGPYIPMIFCLRQQLLSFSSIERERSSQQPRNVLKCNPSRCLSTVSVRPLKSVRQHHGKDLDREHQLSFGRNKSLIHQIERGVRAGIREAVGEAACRAGILSHLSHELFSKDVISGEI